jgi:hypothetical protein
MDWDWGESRDPLLQTNLEQMVETTSQDRLE